MIRQASRKWLLSRRGVAVVIILLSGLLAGLLLRHLRPAANLFRDGKALSGELRRGESLSQALQAHSLPPVLIHSLIQVLHPLFDFRKSQPGDSYRLILDQEGGILSFHYQLGLLESYEVKKVEGRLIAQRRIAELECRRAFIEGKMEDSLFEALEGIGEQPVLAMDFSRIFLWDIDFNIDPRPQDRFRMIVEKLCLGGKFVRYGPILIAQYESQGRVLTGIYFKDSRGYEGFFSPEGKSLKKAILRSPLEFNRITSIFSRQRLHPILGGYRPHLAVDYSAPHGAPIWAVADGVVIFSGWKRGNGNCIVLRHPMGFSTYYNHLSRMGKGIRGGVQVKQRQVIGYVGSTGCSTGPHLDYRIKKDGHYINPLQKITLPGRPVYKKDDSQFLKVRDDLIAQLGRK